MVYKLPTTFTVRKTIKFKDVTYTPGQTIPGNIVAQMRNSDSLLSMKYILPTPDPYSRNVQDKTHTPISLPATVRKKLMGGGTLLSVENPEDDTEMLVEAHVVEKKPSTKTNSTAKKPAAESKPAEKPKEEEQ